MIKKKRVIGKHTVQLFVYFERTVEPGKLDVSTVLRLVFDIDCTCRAAAATINDRKDTTKNRYFY